MQSLPTFLERKFEMDLELEIKVAKLEHEHAVLNARKLELRKQVLETKQNLQRLEVENVKVIERISATSAAIDELIAKGA